MPLSLSTPAKILGLFAWGLFCNASLAAEQAQIHFDAPAIVVAEPINPAVVAKPTMGGELFRLRIPVSTFQSADFRGLVEEYSVQIESPSQSMRVLDFWPRSELYSDIDGTVSVESSQLRDSNFGFKASAAYEPFGRAAAEGNMGSKSSVQERFQRKPPMQILTSSGTMGRGFGVFFKFRPGPLPILEGVREVAILAEVPRGWRADLLQITLTAAGQANMHSTRSQNLAQSRLWITTHREGDAAAAAQATRYVTQERSLRLLAASVQAVVQDKAYPTMWHKLGGTLEIVEPRIPSDYLSQIIFGARQQYYDNASTNRLPVDLRVAILDYWDSRNSLTELSQAPGSGMHVSFKR